MMTEFAIMVKKNFLINLLLAILLFFTTHLLFILLHFGTAPNLDDPVCRNPHFHHLCTDPIFEGHEFFHLFLIEDWNADDALERLQFFYHDLLSSSTEFQSFSLGRHQPLIIDDTELIPLTIDMNVIDLFGKNLKLSEGRLFVEEDFQQFKGYFPILLGHAFNEANDVGDVFSFSFFEVDIDVKVLGILDSDQSLDTHIEWMGSNLDNDIIFPLVANRTNFSLDDDEFFLWYGIYSQLASRFIIVENTPDAIDYVINFIHSSVMETDMTYTLTGMGANIWETIETRNLVRHQRIIIMFLFSSVAALMTIIITILVSIKYQLREKTYFTLMLMGCPKYKLAVNIISETILFFLIAYIWIHDYLIFDQRVFPMGRSILNFPDWEFYPGSPRLSIYRQVWTQNNAMSIVTLFVILLCLTSMVYPIIKLKKLYKNGR